MSPHVNDSGLATRNPLVYNKFAYHGSRGHSENRKLHECKLLYCLVVFLVFHCFSNTLCLYFVFSVTPFAQAIDANPVSLNDYHLLVTNTLELAVIFTLVSFSPLDIFTYFIAIALVTTIS